MVVGVASGTHTAITCAHSPSVWWCWWQCRTYFTPLSFRGRGRISDLESWCGSTGRVVGAAEAAATGGGGVVVVGSGGGYGGGQRGVGNWLAGWRAVVLMLVCNEYILVVVVVVVVLM